VKGEGFAGRLAGRDMLAKGMGLETEMGWGKGQVGCPSLSVHRQKQTVKSPQDTQKRKQYIRHVSLHSLGGYKNSTKIRMRDSY